MGTADVLGLAFGLCVFVAGGGGLFVGFLDLGETAGSVLIDCSSGGSAVEGRDARA